MSATAVPDAPAVSSPSRAGTDLTMEEAVPRFLEYLRSYRSCSPLSISTYACDLRQFQEFLSSRPGPMLTPAQITRPLVIQYAVTLSYRSPVTVRKKLACLSSFFSFLQDMGHLSANPARRLPLPKLEQRVPVTLTEKQAQQLVFAAEPPWHRCLVVLLLATGMRRSEVVQACLEDVDLANRQLLVHGKGSKQRMECVLRTHPAWLGSPSFLASGCFTTESSCGEGGRGGVFCSRLPPRRRPTLPAARPVGEVVRKEGPWAPPPSGRWGLMGLAPGRWW